MIEQQEDSLPLHIRYRPQDFDEVIGQDEVVKALRNVLNGKRPPHSYLFLGPSGCGKTTLARIVAKEVGCSPAGVIEVDAARFSSVEDTRRLVESMHYRAIASTPQKAMIVDECFHKATLIATPYGDAAIEKVESGDLVLSSKGTSQKVKHHFRNNVELSRVTKLTLQNGKIIFCSAEHLFLTTDGWVEAKFLVNKYCCKGIENHDSARENGENQTGKGFIQPEATADSSLCLVQENVCPTPTITAISRNLLARLWLQIRWHQKNRSTFRGLEKGREGWHYEVERRQPKVDEKNGQRCVGQNEEAQRQPRDTGARENNERTKWNIKRLARAAWRKWNSDLAANNFMESTRLALGTGISNTYVSKASSRLWLSNQLQSRFGSRQSVASHRNRRPQPSLETSSRKRQEKATEAETIRVDRVEIYQRGHNDASFLCVIGDKEKTEGFVVFHDLEIEGLPEYLVEGVVVHNCHRLSSAAWASLLKAIEEPASHAYWLLATTDAGKVPTTIKTRCHAVEIRSVKLPTITEYLDAIVEIEEIKIEPDVVQLCSRLSGGSVRQALVYLAAVSGCKDIAEAKRVIASTEEASDMGLFLKQLTAGSLRWEDVTFHLGKMQDEDPEGVRLAVLNYVQKAVLGSKKRDARLMRVLEEFSRPVNRSEKMAPLLVALGRIVQ